MQSDGGTHLVGAFNLVPDSISGAHEVRPYGKQFSFATYGLASHATELARLSALWGGEDTTVDDADGADGRTGSSAARRDGRVTRI